MTATSTVLVVDDDATMREVVQDGLASEGYRVLTASNGQAALDVLHNETVDLILLDMNMPVMDGWTFARTYHRQQPPWVPVVAFTAAQDALHAAAAIGAGGHLNKPFELADLLATVEQNCHGPLWPTDDVGGPAAHCRGSPVADRGPPLVGSQPRA
jgi:CheY-like chemotaxis protein